MVCETLNYIMSLSKPVSEAITPSLITTRLFAKTTKKSQKLEEIVIRECRKTSAPHGSQSISEIKGQLFLENSVI